MVEYDIDLVAYDFIDLNTPIIISYKDVDLYLETFEEYVAKLMKKVNSKSVLKIEKGHDFMGNDISHDSEYYKNFKSKSLQYHLGFFPILFKTKKEERAFAKEEFVEGQFSEKADDWRIAICGLNLLGKCENKSCKAYDKEVICQIGNDIAFDINTDADKAKCPLCKWIVENATDCLLTGCSYCWLGYYKEEGIAIRFDDKTMKNVSGDSYIKTNSKDVNGLKEWKDLKIVVKKLVKSEIRKEIKMCKVCNSDINSENIGINKECGHWYHYDCLSDDTKIKCLCVSAVKLRS